MAFDQVENLSGTAEAAAEIGEAYDVKRAFSRIENELISSMMRNLGRHLKEEEDEGFDWSQWQVEQLKYLQEYRRRNRKEYGPRFQSINDKMEEAIRYAHENGQKEEELNILDAISKDKSIRPRYQNPSQAAVEAAGDAFFRVNDKKLEALVEATHSDMERAEQAVLRRANDQYRKIIFDAQMYANTGAGTVEKAVDMATKDFLSHGIDSIVYKNGSRHTISDYADMYIRTAERRAYHMGEGKKRQEWGESLVIVNKRGTMTGGNYGHACPKCIPWLGKILIDDVYSGGKPDGQHQLLSDAMAQGFLHPRCKDGFTTYFPGISPQPDPDAKKKDIKEAVEAEKEEARENYVERQAEKYERLAEYSMDPENKRIYKNKAEGWKAEAEQLSKELKGDSSETILNRMLEQVDASNDHAPVSLVNISFPFKEEIFNSINNAPGFINNIISKYSDRIFLINENCIGDACFTTNGIRFNIWRDKNNPLGQWRTLFHEIGHNIDYLTGGTGASKQFIDALKNDFENTINAYIAQSSISITKDQAFIEISSVLSKRALSSVSDIYGGLSENKCRGIYGHSHEYYASNPHAVGMEAFAHFFSAMAREDQEELLNLKSAFPMAFDMFEDVLRNSL